MALFHGNMFARTLGYETQVYVSVPQDGRRYNKDGPTKTLILLHGVSDNAAGWIRYGLADAMAAKYNIAVVVPEGLKSFWLDMKHGGQYTTYLTGELPELVGKMFNVPVDPDSLMIAGLSMGGFGAMHAAFSDPEAFYAVGSFSGAVGIGDLIENAEELGKNSDCGANFHNEVVAALGMDRKLEQKDDVLYLIDQAQKLEKTPKIYFACGTEDILVYGQNELLNEYLKNKPFEYKYETWPGVHDWTFWNVALDRFLEYTVGIPAEDNVFGGIPPYVKKR